MSLEALLTLHRGLPRGGPGSDDLTREALGRLGPLRAGPVVYDLGCGPGRQTLVLAEALRTRVVAVDLFPEFLDQLNASARARGLGELVETRQGDMGALDLAPGSVDLIWSEGAAYALGFEEALRRWRTWLAPGGAIALTECSWLTASPPEEARAFWQVAYPGMETEAGNRRRAEGLGLEVLDSFALPASAWWDEYYTPLLARSALLRRPGASAELVAVLDETEREIALFRKHGESYGYVFYLLRSG